MTEQLMNTIKEPGGVKGHGSEQVPVKEGCTLQACVLPRGQISMSNCRVMETNTRYSFVDSKL